MEVFDDLGIVDRGMANGRLAMPTRTTNPSGKVTCRGGEVPETRPDVPYAASPITPEWQIEEAIRDKLAALGGAVAFGTELIGFDQTSDAALARIVSSGGQATVKTR